MYHSTSPFVACCWVIKVFLTRSCMVSAYNTLASIFILFGSSFCVPRQSWSSFATEEYMIICWQIMDKYTTISRKEHNYTYTSYLCYIVHIRPKTAKQIQNQIIETKKKCGRLFFEIVFDLQVSYSVLKYGLVCCLQLFLSPVPTEKNACLCHLLKNQTLCLLTVELVSFSFSLCVCALACIYLLYLNNFLCY